MEISRALLERRETPFEYILTCRFSQDQIEMYFSKFRSRFGWNNNPTVLQFKYALRQLLLKNKIDSLSTANCVDLANTNNSSPITVVKDTKLTLEYQKCCFQRRFGGLTSSTTFQATLLRKCWHL